MGDANPAAGSEAPNQSKQKIIIGSKCRGETTATMGGPDVSLERATPAQRRVFWAAWSGWMLDGYNMSIYFFVLVPALTEVLKLEGIDPSGANIALYGGYLFTAFMLGWASSMLWGWLADRIGRVTVLCLTILTYSIFTGVLRSRDHPPRLRGVSASCRVSASAASGRREPRCCRSPCPNACAPGGPAGCTPPFRSA